MQKEASNGLCKGASHGSVRDTGESSSTLSFKRSILISLTEHLCATADSPHHPPLPVYVLSLWRLSAACLGDSSAGELPAAGPAAVHRGRKEHSSAIPPKAELQSRQADKPDSQHCSEHELYPKCVD